MSLDDASSCTQHQRRIRLSAMYFVLQSGLCAVWWLCMYIYPSLQKFFYTSLQSRSSFMLFFAPDLLLLICGSAYVAWKLWYMPQMEWVQRLTWVTVGAMAYPTVYVVFATWKTNGEGWMATLCMVFAFLGSFFAAWSARPKGSLFEEAPQRPTYQYVLRTALQAAILWSAALLCLPWLLGHIERSLALPTFSTPLQDTLPWFFFACFAWINVHTGYIMAIHGKGTPLPLETARFLVLRGSYRWIRNPMATTGLLMGVCIGWWRGSYLMLLIVFLVGWLWNQCVRPLEEADLQKRFGRSFELYAQNIRCWWPTYPPFDSKRLAEVMRSDMMPQEADDESFHSIAKGAIDETLEDQRARTHSPKS